jgi:hypothetical protein
MKRIRVVIALLALAVGSADGVPEQRYWLASQHDWVAKQGFYLNFECRRREGEALCRIADLSLFLAVADGSAWHVARAPITWETGRDYTVRAVLGTAESALWLDGVQMGTLPGGFRPAAGALQAAQVPEWADAPAEYGVVQTGLTVQAEGSEPIVRELPSGVGVPPGLAAFGTDERLALDWVAPPGKTIEVTARFRIEKAIDLRAVAPLIDRYGQCRAAAWEGKVATDDDLSLDIAREATRLQEMPPRPDADAYGGWTKAGWKEDGTGFFRVSRRDGFFWLISPDGNPCFYTGIDAMPATTWECTPVAGREFLFAELPTREGPWAAAWSQNAWGSQDGDYVCLYTANLLRKYGPDAWGARATEQAIKRAHAWAFCGGGKWGAPPKLVSTPVLHRRGVPVLAGHPDVFDAAVCKVFRDCIAAQIAPHRRNPLVLGWSLGNEMDEVIRADEVRALLRRGAEVAAKRALVDYALTSLPAALGSTLAATWQAKGQTRDDLYREPLEAPAEVVEALRQFYAERYYDFIYRTVKELDPDHLYLGFWLTIGWWENEQDWFLIARHCDVIGYDRYAQTFADERFSRLMQAVDRPVLCGEFSFPPTYAGQRGFGRYGTNVETESQAGERYRDWVRAAATTPWCVGTLWFQYRDQPITGRGSGHGDQLVYGEHFAFGVITETDRPKWDLVTRMREANLQAAAWRAQAARP